MKHSSETVAPVILTRGWSNWIHSFWLQLSPLPWFPTLLHRVCRGGWDRDAKWTIFFLYHLSLASFEAHSSVWAVLGTFAFPFHPGWGTPPLVRYYLVLVDVSLIFFFVLHFFVILLIPKKLIQASSHPEVGQPGIEHKYTFPRIGQVSKK